MTGPGNREALLAAARSGSLAPVVLVRGDLVLAEPAAGRLAAAVGAAWGCEPVEFRRPESLAALVDDLRTFSLFATGKILVAIGTGALADRAAAADLLAEVLDVLPWQGAAEDLTGGARQAAVRLLQVLRLCDVDALACGAERALAELPDALLTGGRERGGGASAAARREELRPLLEAAQAAGLRGAGQTDVTLLGDLLSEGLPERHLLILVEGAAADHHPVVTALASRGALLDAGRLEAGRAGAIGGLERLTAELERETGVAIERDAAGELARRSLRAEESRRGPTGALDVDSTERFAAEYRKLAALAGDRTIGLTSVREQVEDRGDQDVWAILDAIGGGQAGKALAALERRLAGADDRLQERLSLFALVASFARRLACVSALLEVTGVRAGERSYAAFKEKLAPRLQGAIEGLAENPLKGVTAFPLFRIYQAAARWPAAEAVAIPAWLLDTELQLKGESGDPEAALAALVIRLSRPAIKSAPARSAGSRTRA